MYQLNNIWLQFIARSDDPSYGQTGSLAPGARYFLLRKHCCSSKENKTDNKSARVDWLCLFVKTLNSAYLSGYIRSHKIDRGKERTYILIFIRQVYEKFIFLDFFYPFCK